MRFDLFDEKKKTEISIDRGGYERVYTTTVSNSDVDGDAQKRLAGKTVTILSFSPWVSTLAAYYDLNVWTNVCARACASHKIFHPSKIHRFLLKFLSSFLSPLPQFDSLVTFSSRSCPEKNPEPERFYLVWRLIENSPVIDDAYQPVWKHGRLITSTLSK